jgi:hypothetical protein
MDFPQPGGCQCGAIRYEITGPPAAVYACHCTECQKQSGSAFAMAAVIPQEHFCITKGSDSTYRRGNSVQRLGASARFLGCVAACTSSVAS